MIFSSLTYSYIFAGLFIYIDNSVLFVTPFTIVKTNSFILHNIICLRHDTTYVCGSVWRYVQRDKHIHLFTKDPRQNT